jgi:TetR/AcrR family transcriptional regulator of autoinduction and epiphytic fitness
VAIVVEDGRRLRRAQNREAVLDAMVELFAEGVLQPSTDEIAERAGVSSRSLFRYFDDVDDLDRAAIERELAVARPLLEVGAAPHDPTAVKAERVAAARVRLFEAIAPAARAARACAHRHPIVARQIREARAYLRNQLRTLFAPELAARPAVLPAVDALCTFETYELLRGDQGLSRARTTAALTAALLELLGP